MESEENVFKKKIKQGGKVTVKAKVMNESDHNVSLVFDEKSIKQDLLYTEKCNTIEE